MTRLHPEILRILICLIAKIRDIIQKFSNDVRLYPVKKFQRKFYWRKVSPLSFLAVANDFERPDKKISVFLFHEKQAFFTRKQKLKKFEKKKNDLLDVSKVGKLLDPKMRYRVTQCKNKTNRDPCSFHDWKFKVEALKTKLKRKFTNTKCQID